jgi:quinohemoprotein ethanol dehydrogenase
MQRLAALRLALWLSFAFPVLAMAAPPLASRPTTPSPALRAVNWPAYGNTADEQRFSPLEQIHAGNVAKLGLDWALDVPDAVAFVSTPLMVDGVLYFSGDRSIVRAVDARTGRRLWTYDPEAGKHSPRSIAIGWNSHRGIAYENGKVDFATVLDAQRQVRRAKEEGVKARADQVMRLADIDRLTGEE